MRVRCWDDTSLLRAVNSSKSIRSVLIKLGLRPAGGNYVQIKKRIYDLGIDISHFTGMGWNVGLAFVPKKAVPLVEILTENSYYQCFKLKKRLFSEGLKRPRCELCGWGEITGDGRVPVELDHINGNHTDNRIENLRILCPNCHSLQSTHRGLNKVKYT